MNSMAYFIFLFVVLFHFFIELNLVSASVLHEGRRTRQVAEEDDPDRMFSGGDCLLGRGDGSSVEFYPHPTDCTKYYMCDHRKPLLKMCPDDLYFNPKLKVCDHRTNVVCEDYQRDQTK